MQPNLAVRSQFPALQQSYGDCPSVFFDGPAGTQVPQRVADAMAHYLLRTNANTGGAFRTSRLTDELTAEAHRAAADLLGAASPNEVVLGHNMTTLTFHVSRSLGHWLAPGDEIIVTHLDHDANILPWVLLARDRGATVRWIDFRLDDCTLNLDTLADALSPRTKLVALGYASNAVGTINPVQHIIEMAHAVGALAYVDAVQYVPHGPTDVQAIGADFLACSAYKFFGPHVGLLYGRLDLLERLEAYKVRPAHDAPPDKFETGTQNYECQAGLIAAVDYLASVEKLEEGRNKLKEVDGSGYSLISNRRNNIVRSMEMVQTYERGLCERLLGGLRAMSGVRIYGITDPTRLDQRVPTVAFTLEGMTPRALAEALGEREIYVWDGNFYALAVTSFLGLEPNGVVRVGLAHYNTTEEVDLFLNALDEIRKPRGIAML